MIVCPRCRKKIHIFTSIYSCDSCQYCAKIIDGIVFFAPESDDDFKDYDSSGLDTLFAAEEHHFWFKARKNFIKNLFDKYVNQNEKIIEIGAGTGNISRMLINSGFEICVGEIHKNGLLYAKQYGIKELFQFDLMRPPFYEHFDVVGLFDVLEHIDEDGLALKNIYNMLKPGGKCILTVPAHGWLWSRDDAIARHKRRYEQDGTRRLFIDNGFKIIVAKNFFVFLLPLLLLRTFLKKDNGSQIENRELMDYGKSLKIHPLTNSILYSIMCLENFLMRNISPGIGGSIAVVAVKE